MLRKNDLPRILAQSLKESDKLKSAPEKSDEKERIGSALQNISAKSLTCQECGKCGCMKFHSTYERGITYIRNGLRAFEHLRNRIILASGMTVIDSKSPYTLASLAAAPFDDLYATDHQGNTEYYIFDIFRRLYNDAVESMLYYKGLAQANHSEICQLSDRCQELECSIMELTSMELDS